MRDPYAIEPGLYVWDDVIPIFQTVIKDRGPWSAQGDPHERCVVVLKRDGRLYTAHMIVAIWEKVA